ncbi:PorP/SprF family type IX secretion system membrane protein [Sabulilitoribacter arenilitoris]|uniref:PorP/SprF family type IX secretion system membrane protein n=1 Tax=Wocania arenilitoris TaxID=2044858 RepID=A0AAE3JLB5_9FLAO|nr:PorP/SprF family type IX secretion system membrane protein [Wocania arenilitoris]MCF7568027.1 PorP/SprF family type IX secretion system membrane protein [Wocania arenilitoris]
MKKLLLHIVLFFCITQQFYSQEDGIVAFNIPTRNSLKFNKYTINPTFSFVREQNRYFSFYNKRQWVQFDDAPLTYLASYSGRFKENIGIGVGLFQQDYGVLTTFGGVLNFAYNAVLNTDSNLTFGMNFGFYKSGISEGRVITNFPDPSLQNISSNSIITINPGINYGTAFFDFGVSINNAVSYNLQTSEIIEDNPEQTIQGHIMYTGYVNSGGFFDESKFTGLLRSEFKKDQTIISGLVMLNVPKGIWAQAGYNSLYGVSGGLGINISAQIAIEYNYEKAIGDFSNFGNSHEITLAYKFKNSNRYSYSGDDNEQALLTTKKRRKVLAKNNKTPKLSAEQRQIAKQEAKARIEARRLAAQVKAEERRQVSQQAKEKAKPEVQVKIPVEEAQKKAETQRLKQEEAAKIKAKAEEQTRIKEAAEKTKADTETRAIVEKEAKTDEEESIEMIELEGVLVPVAKDKVAREMNSLAKLTTNAKIEQQNLLSRLREMVENRDQDLKDLKEENDLSERGIYKAPKPFKSVTAENAKLESLKLEIDNVIESQNEKISQLENLYNERLKTVSDGNDPTNVFYFKTIQDLKSEQLQALSTKERLLSTIEKIKVATEVERKRRIKRATYDNEEERYLKDREALKQIKQFTPLASEPLTAEDFDSGETQSSSIQIVKDVKNTESGFYVVIGVHSDIGKRDEFLRKAVAAGETNIDFFFDVATSKYYIYYQKFDNIESARSAMELKGSKPYNNNMSMVKVEN